MIKVKEIKFPTNIDNESSKYPNVEYITFPIKNIQYNIKEISFVSFTLKVCIICDNCAIINIELPTHPNIS